MIIKNSIEEAWINSYLDICIDLKYQKINFIIKYIRLNVINQI